MQGLQYENKRRKISEGTVKDILEDIDVGQTCLKLESSNDNTVLIHIIQSPY